MNVTGGSTDVTTYFVLRLAADGTEATGLTITNFDLQYTRSGATPAAKVDATALAATNSAHGDNQAIEIDATDQPGLYRVDWPDAAFAAGVREVILSVKCATCFTEHLRVQIDTPVNLTSIAADQQSATDLKDFADAGYDPSTNKVQGVVLTDTITTYTGNTPQTGDTYALANGASGFVAMKADTAATLADTNELQTDWANGGRLDLILDARASQTSVDDLPTNSELATALAAADDAVLTAISTLNNLGSAEAQAAAEAALAAYGASTFAPATDAVEGSVTYQQSMRLLNAAAGGKASGLETTNAKYRDLADSKDRIDATVDVDGNRTAVTLDLT